MTDVVHQAGVGEIDLTGDHTATDSSSESKGERTKRRLLEIAIEHFGSSGYRGASVSEITRAAGLTQAASYTYFKNKEALFREAVDADAENLIREAREQAAEVPVRQLIPMLVLFLSSGLDHHPLTRRVLKGQETEGAAQLIDLPAVHEVGNLVSERVRKGQEDGEVRTDVDPDMIGAGAEALGLGLVMSLAAGDGATTDRHTLGVLNSFDAMLRPPS